MATKKTANKHACGYIRMSSAKQESSPDQQRKEITVLAKRKGYRIVAWYADEGISGDEIEKRPQFCRMLQDAQNGKFSVIMCWDQDRFGRFDSLKAGYVIEPLRQAGVRLFTVTQGEINWNDFAGRMIYAIQQEGKNQYLISLSNNVLRGLIESAREGNAMARSPFGYDRVFYDSTGEQVHRVVGNERFSKPKGWRAKLDVSEHESEAETVRWIFDQYANTNANTNSIARELNRRKLKTRWGYSWQAQSVKKLLENPVYAGQQIFGKRPTGRFNQTGQGGIGGDEQIIVCNAHPALVDESTFKRVQKKLAKRSRPWQRSRCNDYILSGLLVCGETGLKFVGRRASVGNRQQYYIVKVNKGVTGGPQRCWSVRKDWIEKLVISRMLKLFESNGLEERIRRSVTEQLASRNGSQDEAKSLQRQLNAIEKKIAKGSERLLLVDDDNLTDAMDVLSAWRIEREELKEKIAACNGTAILTPEQEIERIVQQINVLRETFQKAEPGKMQAALASVIKDIQLYWSSGGPRKWRLDRGVIRLGDNLFPLVTSRRRNTRTKPRLMA